MRILILRLIAIGCLIVSLAFGAAYYRNEQYGFSLSYGAENRPYLGIASSRQSRRAVVQYVSAWPHPRIVSVSIKQHLIISMSNAGVWSRDLGNLHVNAGNGTPEDLAMPPPATPGWVTITWPTWPRPRPSWFFMLVLPLWIPIVLFAVPPSIIVIQLLTRLLIRITRRTSVSGGFFVVGK